MKARIASIALVLASPAVASADVAPAPVPAYPTPPAYPPAPPAAPRPAPSTAAPGAAAATDFTNAVRGDFGLGGPVGFLGVTFTHAFVDWFAIEVGAGWGLSGLQLSAIPKLFLGSAHHRFMFGLGPSVGIPTDSRDAGGLDRQTIVFLNVEVGYDLRTESGISFEIGVGGWVIVNDVEWNPICFDDCGTPLRSGSTLPMVELGVGHWF